MKAFQRDAGGEKSVNKRYGLEMLLFLAVSVIGIYALGNGLMGVFESGKGIDLLWLAVTAAAIMILFAQMGRVHDSWPSRKTGHQRTQPANPEVLTNEPGPHNEEKER